MASDPRARFKIVGDASDYKRALASAKRETQTFAGSVKTALKAGAIAGAAAVTATSLALVRLTAEASKNADALAKQADVLGISTQKLAAYQHAARLTGSTNDGLEKGLRKLQKSIVDANNGLTTYTRAFEALRLDPAQLEALTPDQQFEQLAKAFAGVEDQTKRVAIAYDLFGGRNTALLNTLVLTGEQLGQIEADTRAWGVALSRVDARQIEAANDATERAQTAMQGLGTNIALAIAPLREDLANAFADSAAESQGFRNEIQATMEALVVGANFAVNAIRGIRLAIQGARLAALAVQEAATEAGSKLPKFLTVGVAGIAPGALGSEDKLAAIRSEIDETGARIDELVGKFQNGDQALAQFRASQEAALQRARESLAGGRTATGEDTGEFEIFGEREREQLAARLQAVQDTLLSETEAMRKAYAEREAIVQEAFERDLIGIAERDELTTELRQQLQDEELARAQAHADKLLEVERQRLAEQQALEQQHQQTVLALRAAAIDMAIGLLHTFGQRSKTLARAAILVERAVAVARIIINTNAAAVRAVAELGPIAGPPVAAKIKAWGYGLAAATAAVGLAQAAQVGGGGPGLGGGASIGASGTASSIGAGDLQDQGAAAGPTRKVEIYVQGNGILLQDELIDVIREAVDERDVVVIGGNSRQAAELRGAA